MHTRLSRFCLLGLFFLLVGCDHVTKYAAEQTLRGGPPKEVIRGIFDMRYVGNTDVAFNLFRWLPEATRKPLLLALGAAVLSVLGFALMKRRGLKIIGPALLLITAGGVGNYLDRLFRGHVVDFLHVHHWPVFNVADIYVTLGGILLVLYTWRTHQASVKA